jgi:hypothetical protein
MNSAAQRTPQNPSSILKVDLNECVPQHATLEVPRMDGETVIAFDELFQLEITTQAKALPESFVTRPPTLADVKALASMHRDVFPDYFLSHLGQKAVEAFYEDIITGTGKNFSSIAESNDQLIGFTAITFLKWRSVCCTAF